MHLCVLLQESEMSQAVENNTRLGYEAAIWSKKRQPDEYDRGPSEKRRKKERGAHIASNSGDHATALVTVVLHPAASKKPRKVPSLCKHL